MLYKSLHFKLVLIFVIFIVLVISIVGVVIINRVFGFYTEDFTATISRILIENEELLDELRGVMLEPDFYERQKEILRAQHGNLGINNACRNLYILDMTGSFRAGTDEELGARLIRTPNMLEAMSRNTGDSQTFLTGYMDFAIYLSNGEAESIIYIKDTQEQMLRFSQEVFSIIINALLLGLLVAAILSFPLAKAITSPIQRITRAASTLAEGDFKRKIEIAAHDEIGTLAETFNDMAEKLENTLDEVSSEREKLKIIFSYLQDGVLVFSSGGMLMFINPEADNILKGFGYQKSLFDFWQILNLEERGDVSIIRDIAYDERIFDINTSGFKYMDGNREAMGTIIVMQDITQRYSLERSRREFIANVSHELRTPLATIRGAAETIFERKKLGAAAKVNYLNMILSECDRMTRIVQDLLVVSRVDNKKMMWKFATLNLEAMIKNIYEKMRGEADKKEQSFKLYINGDIPPVFADKDRIEQVLLNIISNAIKYTQDGGHIEVMLSPHEIKDRFSGIRFIIKDNGYGIPSKDLPHVFERFYRVDKSRSSEAGGTGLGLSIAQDIVLAHKGQITLDSTLGAGTVVTIILPKENHEAENNGAENREVEKNVE